MQFQEDNPHALATVNSNHPRPEVFAGLRDAQLVIARSYGFPGWQELSEAVELAQYAEKDLSDKAALLIQLGCVQYNGNDLLRNFQRARKLYAAYPEIAETNFYSALVANNASVVSNYLGSDNTLAKTPGGPFSWPPLLYLTYSRIGDPEHTQQSVLILKQLLDCGAEPNSHVMLNDTYRFTALTGAMGEGEQGVNQPPHQNADEMVALLLDAGANPNEGQGLYNTMFTDSADKWLAVLLSRGLKASDSLNWDATGQAAQVTTLEYQLASAVDSNRESRVKLLLNAGASPNARNTYNGRTIHTNAVLANHKAIAQLLEEKGAIVERLDISDQFRLACVRADSDAIAGLLESNPALKENPTLLHAAAEHASPGVVRELIKQGFDINGQSKHGRTLLHNYALSNDTASIQALISLGARTDILDNSHDSIAAGFAAYSGSYEAMRLLLDTSNSLLDVCCCAYLERAQTLVEQSPAALHDRTDRGNTVLHVIGAWLHDEPEYETYKSLVDLLIKAGADINAKNKQDQIPIQFCLANGFDTLAELLAEHS